MSLLLMRLMPKDYPPSFQIRVARSGIQLGKVLQASRGPEESSGCFRRKRLKQFAWRL